MLELLRTAEASPGGIKLLTFKELLRVTVALGVLSPIIACDYLAHPRGTNTQPPSQRVQVPVMPSNRFQLVSSGGVQVALDTQTGKICKTHDWPLFANSTIPLCFNLYQQFPSVGKLQEVEVWDKDASGKIVKKGMQQEFVIPLEEPVKPVTTTRESTKRRAATE